MANENATKWNVLHNGVSQAVVLAHSAEEAIAEFKRLTPNYTWLQPLTACPASADAVVMREWRPKIPKYFRTLRGR